MPTLNNDMDLTSGTASIRIPPKACLPDRPELGEDLREDGCRERRKPQMLPQQIPMPLGDTSNQAIENAVFSGRTTSDRGEFIELVKRGERPRWLPSKNLGALLQQEREGLSSVEPQTPVPAPRILSESNNAYEDNNERWRHVESVGLEITRPRSALHSGNFTDNKQRDSMVDGSLERTWGLVDQPPWLTFPSLQRKAPRDEAVDAQPIEAPVSFDARHSSPPSSLSSVFHSRPPTSPLVQSQSNEELESTIPELGTSMDSSPGEPMSRKRRPSEKLWASPSISESYPDLLWLSTSKPPTNHRQAHQPRRSLVGSGSSTTTPPHTPTSHARRSSFTIDSSPVLHASMVGSYEESILRGRMSTTPSKPLDFVAQIGVLGIGDCRPALRCPAHVTVPFPAVFYSYGSTSHGRSNSIEDGPSPYVGQIDLEHGLPEREPNQHKRRRRDEPRASRSRQEIDRGDYNMESTNRSCRGPVPDSNTRSSSPRAPPGGSYRIPQKGQLQIIIKNPNKTAVKLFLVPYDLAGMEPGTKTFIRQRSYSAGPLLDSSMLSSTSRVPEHTAQDRAMLRYLVHLHICCPSRGRFYLYKSIRVVFANRVPDGKEKLRIDVSLPEPKYSTYKALRDSAPSIAGAGLAAEKAFRRRSAGFALMGPYHSTNDPIQTPPDRNTWSQAPRHEHFRHRAASLASATSFATGTFRSVSGPHHLETHWSRPSTPVDTTLDRLGQVDHRLGRDHSANVVIDGDIADTPASLLANRLEGLGVPLAGAQDGASTRAP